MWNNFWRRKGLNHFVKLCTRCSSLTTIIWTEKSLVRGGVRLDRAPIFRRCKLQIPSSTPTQDLELEENSTAISTTSLSTTSLLFNRVLSLKDIKSDLKKLKSITITRFFLAFAKIYIYTYIYSKYSSRVAILSNIQIHIAHAGFH